MANIQNFEVNGVSYAYDTESRNPLSLNVFEKAINDGLIYDKDTKAPAEVVGISANKLKTDGSASAGGDTRKIRSFTFYAMGSCFVFPLTITYKGSLNNTSGKPNADGHLVGYDEKTDNVYEEGLDGFSSIEWLNDDNPGFIYYGTDKKLTDDSTDEGFELVSFEKTIKVGGVTVTITNFGFY